MKKSILGMFIFASLLLRVSNHLSMGQEIEGLFRDVPESNKASLKTDRSAAQDPTVIRSRQVEISLSTLSEEESQQTANFVVLNLFDDVLLIGDKRSVEWRSPTQYTWCGQVVGFEHSLVVLVVNGENVGGNINVEGRIYQVRPVARGVHSVREINQSAFHNEAPPIFPEALQGLPLADSPMLRQANEVRIDVLVVYTADAANATYEIEAEIQLAVDQTNAIYRNSGIDQSIRLVHSAEVDYTETGDADLDIERLRVPDDGFLDEVHDLRNAYNADLVCLWVETMNDYCGVANGLAIVTPLFAPWAFSVVKRECATGNDTFAHELGHNMGAHHDWYVFPLPVPYAYSHGYVDREYRWRTIMAYSDECEDHETYCPRVPYFSNPDIEYEGSPLGVPAGSRWPADNRRSLNNTAATVAAFRVEGGPNPWGAASVLGMKSDPTGDALCYLLALLTPLGAAVAWKRIKRWKFGTFGGEDLHEGNPPPGITHIHNDR